MFKGPEKPFSVEEANEAIKRLHKLDVKNVKQEADKIIRDLERLAESDFRALPLIVYAELAVSEKIKTAYLQDHWNQRCHELEAMEANEAVSIDIRQTASVMRAQVLFHCDSTSAKAKQICLQGAKELLSIAERNGIQQKTFERIEMLSRLYEFASELNELVPSLKLRSRSSSGGSSSHVWTSPIVNYPSASGSPTAAGDRRTNVITPNGGR